MLDALARAGRNVPRVVRRARPSDFVRMNRGKVRQPGSVDAALSRRRASSAARAMRREQLSLAGDARRRPRASRGRRSAGSARRAARSGRRSAPAVSRPRFASSRDVRGEPLPAPRRSSTTVLAAAAGTRSRRPVRRRPRLSRLRQLARPAQLARGDGVQPAVEPLSPRRQGGEVRPVGLRVGRSARSPRRCDDARDALAYIARPPARSRRASTACFSRRRRSRTSLRCCAGADSPRARSRRSRASLTRMRDGAGEAAALDPRVTIAEATADGVAPSFQGEGFARPPRVPLIEAGTLVGALVSPRTAREFSLDSQRRERPGSAGVARDGRRHARRRAMRSRRSAPGSTSATSTTSTTRIVRRAG